MLLRPALLALASLSLITFLSPGQAADSDPAPARQLVCHDHAEVARQLRDKYDEAPVSLGLQANGDVLQVFASPRRGTWTVVSTSPEGTACILAAGERWESFRPASLDPPA